MKQDNNFWGEYAAVETAASWAVTSREADFVSGQSGWGRLSGYRAACESLKPNKLIHQARQVALSLIGALFGGK